MSEKRKRETRQYTKEYKVEAIKLAQTIGSSRAARELGVPLSTMNQWRQGAQEGRIDTGQGTQTPETGLSQAAEIQKLRAENKALAKRNRQLEEENAFLEEASAFFAASRQKLTKGKE